MKSTFESAGCLLGMTSIGHLLAWSRTRREGRHILTEAQKHIRGASWARVVIDVLLFLRVNQLHFLLFKTRARADPQQRNCQGRGKGHADRQGWEHDRMKRQIALQKTGVDTDWFEHLLFQG